MYFTTCYFILHNCVVQLCLLALLKSFIKSLFIIVQNNTVNFSLTKQAQMSHYDHICKVNNHRNPITSNTNTINHNIISSPNPQPTANPNRAPSKNNLLLIRVQPTANLNWALPVQPTAIGLLLIQIEPSQCNLLLIWVQPTADPNWPFPVQPTANPNWAFPVQLTANPNQAFPVQPTANLLLKLPSARKTDRCQQSNSGSSINHATGGYRQLVSKITYQLIIWFYCCI